MTRISLITLVLATGFIAAANAQTPPKTAIHTDQQAIHTDYQTLATDDNEIRELDRKRDDALRSKDPATAQKIQAQIDQLRAARKNIKQDISKDESNIAQQKRREEEECARNPVCAKKKRQEEISRQLDNYKRQLNADEAAAARIANDKAAIDKLETALKQ